MDTEKLRAGFGGKSALGADLGGMSALAASLGKKVASVTCTVHAAGTEEGEVV